MNLILGFSPEEVMALTRSESPFARSFLGTVLRENRPHFCVWSRKLTRNGHFAKMNRLKSRNSPRVKTQKTVEFIDIHKRGVAQPG